ncbi:MAG: HPr family phosphocarrier protein [Halieaceae bacterium]|jgi:phosphocarrier protein HPr
MSESLLQVVNPLGLHARPAAKVVECASRFSSDITLCFKDREIDAKSIMSVLMLAAGQGSEIVLRISGEDQAAAREAMENLFASGFGELE